MLGFEGRMLGILGSYVGCSGSYFGDLGVVCWVLGVICWEFGGRPARGGALFTHGADRRGRVMAPMQRDVEFEIFSPERKRVCEREK